ncbi:septal ring lytic transglycosylase RlpA family protein [Uliginosibacterium sp. 31-12]|uniref:septal ring lytic transglycosylase RlpA family protein n=1 Tax=Uliginosibacterium sp. 31-12 TaxID=3062781 RepID=UPI0026E28C15|nr:septal ring lytic transglycosylase RlpA family protein [Uliginosibacterium sp. 31-12]MDO6386207.1 septal ring lytic transglycosylase RlpA family protein [Uliginosibacterium sp. 31-12]
MHSFHSVNLLVVLAMLLLAACASTPYEESTSPRPAPVQKPVAVPAKPAPSSPVLTRKGGGFYKDDGPGEDVPPNLDEIPDAVPRREPIRPANARTYEALGQTFKPMQTLGPFSQTGVGSWYGKKFHGAKTSSGERYDMYAMSAAHPTLPLPSYARVTNLENGRSVVVRVNDRGPFLHSRIIDLSYTAAYKLGYVSKGSARLQVDAITAEEIDSGVYARTPVSPPAQVASAAPAEAPSRPVIEPATPDPLEALATAVPAVEPAAPAPLVASGVFLQLGAFASSANADGFRDYVKNELKWLGQDVSTHLVGDKYRLRVGPFNDAAEARRVADRIAAAIRIKPFVVQ